MKLLRVILLVLAALMVSSCYTSSYYVHKLHPIKILTPYCPIYYDGWGSRYDIFYLRSWEYGDCRLWFDEYWRRPMEWRYPAGKPRREPLHEVRQPIRLPEPRSEARRSESRRPEVRQREPQRRPEARQPAPQRKPESRQAQPRQSGQRRRSP